MLVAEPRNKSLSTFHSSGILLIDKPEGPSSARVVQRVKTLLEARKVGHLGTLDPFASGLLLLGINEGTKIADLYLTAQKSYTGVIAFGVETDTQDPTGRVVEVREVPPFWEAELGALSEAFSGSQWQVPPMFSALKKSGVPLYRLARQGQSVPRPPRQINIERLRLWKLNEAEVGFEVACSKGTYIRALAGDMGKSLGCGAHLKSLRRLSCGDLTLEQSISLDEIETLTMNGGKIPLLSLNRALAHLRAVCLEDRWLARLTQGQQEVLARIDAPKEGENTLRVVDSRDNLIALVRWADGARRWHLLRVFALEAPQ